MIQYPKLIHATLPSADEYNGNTSIIKDPPKSIFTRRNVKVNDHSEITEEIDGAGDRVCEIINTYARGINPFVGTQYSNYGNETTQAYLPYRVMDRGAFRPPIIKPQDLLPLSRQVRLFTPITATPGYMQQTGECVAAAAELPRREINIENVVTTCAARPAAIYHGDVYDDVNVYTEKNIGNPVYKTFSTNANSYLATPRYDVCPRGINQTTENYSLRTNVNGRGAPVNNQNYVRPKLTDVENYSLTAGAGGHKLNAEINVNPKLNSNNVYSMNAGVSGVSSVNNSAQAKKIKDKIGSYGAHQDFGRRQMFGDNDRHSLIQLPRQKRIGTLA